MLRIVEVDRRGIVIAMDPSDARRLALACYKALDATTEVSGRSIPDDGIVPDWYCAVAAVFDLCALTNISLGNLDVRATEEDVAQHSYSKLRSGELWDDVFE